MQLALDLALFPRISPFGPPVVAGRVLKIGSVHLPSVRPSVRPSAILSRRFLGFVSLVSSELWHGTRILCEVVRERAGFSGKTFLLPKLGKWAKNKFFFNILENFVIKFYWIWSIMKIYIICCVPSQIPYFGNFCSRDMGQNVLSRSDCMIF